MTGFADLHTHQFANLAFGGQGFYGSPYRSDPDVLKTCAAIHGAEGQKDPLETLYQLSRRRVSFVHSTEGDPDFPDWPRWDDATHQAMFEDWLQRAVQGGLRLIIMLATNNVLAAKAAGLANGYTGTDMDAVDKQIKAAWDMQAYLDAKLGAGKGWYRIVKTPAEARDVMNAGQLAVVLGIEVDFLFGSEQDSTGLSQAEIQAQLDKYQKQGVQHIFPIHWADNQFGGAAYANPVQQIFSRIIDLPGVFQGVFALDLEPSSVRGYPYTFDGGMVNKKGLNPLGEVLLTELMARGMTFDVDHMSARTRDDVLKIAADNDYPVLASHSVYVDLAPGGNCHEGHLRSEEIATINAVGGMLAPILHQNNVSGAGFVGPGPTIIPHTCGETSESWVQAYLYAASKMPGKAIGMGSDFNGFALEPGPRFGNDACPGGRFAGPALDQQVTYPFIATATNIQMPQYQYENRTFDVNTDGLSHVGLLPDFVRELEVLALTPTDLAPLLDSAEGYVRVWEKARASRKNSQIPANSGNP
jgi:microsomal dipeptidase-like Zn-dependent dipeptidase